MIKIARSKFHGITITESDLNYHGSITLDPEHCKMAGIMPLEYLDVWNKNSGARIQTYAIYGQPGSRCCVLNGAAARTCQAGDELIICASEYIRSEELTQFRPTVLTFTPGNEVDQILRYDIGLDGSGGYSFSITDETALEQPCSAVSVGAGMHMIPDLEKMKNALKAANWSGKEIADFISKYTAA